MITLVNKRLAVLDAMSTVTKSTDMEDFMRLSGLTSSEVVATLKELAQDGFVVKTKHGFAIAEKGLIALTALRQLPIENAFHFYSGIDQPLGILARSIKKFHDVVGTVDSSSLEFHLARGDFENWVRTSVKDDVFANDLLSLGKEGLEGEVLRKQILLSLLERFGEDVLLRDWES